MEFIKRFFYLIKPGLKLKRFIFIGLGSFIIISCQKKEITSPLVLGSGNNPNALVITGYGFNSIAFYLNPSNSAGHYDTSLHQTFIAANEDTDSLHLELLIRFNGESAFSFNDTIPKFYNATDSLTITNKNNQKVTYYS